MSLAYFDCFAGASGDMILGSLLDAGLHLDELRDALLRLGLQDWNITAERVNAGGLAATRVSVNTDDRAETRTYAALDSILAQSSLSSPVKQDAGRILRRMAEAESRLHGVPIEQVHLHELGGIDTLIDIVGAVSGLELLGIDEIYVSSLPVGNGQVMTRHGMLPLPAPAMVELARGAPLRSVDIATELVTPTGAAILTTLSRGFSSFPAMTCTSIGYGAGTRELPIPNVLRLLIGSPVRSAEGALETLVVLETNIDDMNPQLFDHAMSVLLKTGALDVWLTPIHMKKNRLGTMLSVLAPPSVEVDLVRTLFQETSTLGVRRQEILRHALAREIRSVETRYGPVHIKVALMNGVPLRAQPEYEDCREIAQAKNLPLIDVLKAAESAAQKLILLT